MQEESRTHCWGPQLPEPLPLGLKVAAAVAAAAAIVTDHATTALLHYQLPQMPDVVVRSFMPEKASSEHARSPEPCKKSSKRRHSLEREAPKAKEPAAKKPWVWPEKAKHRLETETELAPPSRSKSPSPVPWPSSALSIPPPLKVVSPPLRALISELESEGEIRDDIPLLDTEPPSLLKDSATLGTEADEALLDPETERILRENPDLIFDSLTGCFLQHVDPRHLSPSPPRCLSNHSCEGLHHLHLGPCHSVRIIILQPGGCQGLALPRLWLLRNEPCSQNTVGLVGIAHGPTLLLTPGHPPYWAQAKTWLRSYIKLFQAPCQRCGKFLQDGLPPTWRDFRTLEAFHDTCRQ
ncbi:hypothetical protein JD844_004584 [Phrynosoma platyrhinos]|uniref:Mediator complex subunit 27 n=1 Tax=Phrynosoma platyrhinos TaxID=52577 RepID=A0ABQ7SDI9_PHRPL|nr:hypothetical protein JD844_004584 [Phrynosoma platyrhinos]